MVFLLLIYYVSPADEEFAECDVRVRDRILVFTFYWYFPVLVFAGISVSYAD